MPDELLTVYDVAERLKVNQQTVRNWIDRGELGGIRVGARRVRVLESELQRFIADSSAAQTPDPARARAALADALTAVTTAESDEEMVPALRRLATAATTLARVLARQAAAG